MKRIKTFGGMLCAAVFVMACLLSTSCKKDEQPAPEAPIVKDPVTFVVDATAYYNTATVAGEVSEIVEGAEYGVVYATTESPEVGDDATSLTFVPDDEDLTFAVHIEGLDEGTTYHYRAYICENGEYTYSEDATFETQTKPIPVVAITSAEAMNGGITYTFAAIGESKNLPEGYEIGVEHSTSSEFAADLTTVAALVDFIDDNSNDDDYDDLNNVYKKRNLATVPFATYYYRPYVKDEATGEVTHYEGGSVPSTLSFELKPYATESTSASFRGDFNTMMSKNDNYVYGLLLTTVSDFDATTGGVTNITLAQGMDPEDWSNFNMVLTGTVDGLTGGTTYYYRGYFKTGDIIYYYTDIKSFTTPKAIPVATIASAEVMNGGITYTFAAIGESKNLPEGYEIGVEHSTSSEFAADLTTVAALVDFIDDNSNDDDYDDLNNVYKKRNLATVPFATYYYRSYVKDLATGDVKRYEGGSVPSTLSFELKPYATKSTSASFRGDFNTMMSKNDNYTYGILVSTLDNFDATTSGVINQVLAQGMDPEDWSNFNMVLTGTVNNLTAGTTYYYRGYFKTGGVIYYYTDIKSFTL